MQFYKWFNELMTDRGLIPRYPGYERGAKLPPPDQVTQPGSHPAAQCLDVQDPVGGWSSCTYDTPACLCTHKWRTLRSSPSRGAGAGPRLPTVAPSACSCASFPSSSAAQQLAVPYDSICVVQYSIRSTYRNANQI